MSKTKETRGRKPLPKDQAMTEMFQIRCTREQKKLILSLGAVPTLEARKILLKAARRKAATA